VRRGDIGLAIRTRAMLEIRPEQIKAFEETALRRFEDEMVRHLMELAPKHCEAVGEAGVRQVIRLGIKRGAGYGLTNRGPVRFYIDLMIMLGSDFDTDPQYPWAAAILKERELPDQMERADRLFEKSQDFAQKVFGPDYCLEKAAVRRAGDVKFEDLPVSIDPSGGQLAGHLERVFPEKARYIGAPAIRGLAMKAIGLAQQHGLARDRGPTVLAGLMFAFGHGIVTDPQFPWVAATLNNEKQDTATRTERLFRRAMTYQRLGVADQP
jgi:hypothetical protein